MRINFGELVIGDIAKERLKRAIDKSWISEGGNVKEFEEKLKEGIKENYNYKIEEEKTEL